jgi:hypothetical protein
MLGKREFFQASSDEWVDWATEMMEAGHDNPHLVQRAGTSVTINRFQFDGIVERALQEPSICAGSRNEIINGYVYYLATEMVAGNILLITGLSELRDLCHDTDYDEMLFPFYLLFYAKSDLGEYRDQFYWDGADASNIDSIIQQECTKWIERYLLRSQNSA